MDRAAIVAWTSLPFPVGSSVDEVDELHADLAYWDAMTADAVLPMADDSGSYDPGVLDSQTGLADLRERLLNMRTRGGMRDADTIDQYVEYVDALVAVHRWAAGSR
jgi:hypothetical protein